MTDANISFSISLPLDQALELLAPIQKKRIGTVQIGNSVKQSKSSDLPKGQPAKKEQVPVFKGVPITTLNNVIDSLVSNYKDKPAFSYAEARHLTQENVSRTLLSYTLAFAIQQGKRTFASRYSLRSITVGIRHREAFRSGKGGLRGLDAALIVRGYNQEC